MPKRRARPIFDHDGYILRLVKTLTDGSELLYCDKRQSLGCLASAKRINSKIYLNTEHNGHEADYKVSSEKIARHHLKQIASATTCSAKELLDGVQGAFGPLDLVGKNRGSLSKMIYRARQGNIESPSTSNNDTRVEEVPDMFRMNNETELPDEEVEQKFNPIPLDNLTDVLKSIKTEEEESLETWINSALETEQSTQNPVVDLSEESMNIIRDMLKQTVQKEIKEVVNKTNPYLPGSNSFIGSFLRNLENLTTHSEETTRRIEKVMEKLQNKEYSVNLDELLETTLRQLEK